MRNLSLPAQVLLALIAGSALGLAAPQAALSIAFVGDIFTAALKMLIVPLIFASMTTGVASLGDPQKLGYLGSRTLLYFAITTFIAVVIGITLVELIQPGKAPGSEALLAHASDATKAQLANRTETSISGFLYAQIGKVLVNPFEAMADGNVLGVIMFSWLLGLSLAGIGDRATGLLTALDALNEAMVVLVTAVMKFTPYGVFALIAAAIARSGVGVLVLLGQFTLTVVLGLALQALLVFPLLLNFVARVSPLRFFRAMREALSIAFSTASSNATLPVTLRCVEQNLGVAPQVSRFVIPLGATVNMNGTALYEATAVIFIAQLYGVDLTFAQIVTVFLTSTLAAVGAAGIPAAGTVTMAMVLGAVGLPLEGIGIVLAVDRFLDMCRTTINVVGDAAGAVLMHNLSARKLGLAPLDEN